VPAYRQALGNRNVTGLPISEVFAGDEVDQLTRLLKTAVREGQTVHTPPIDAGVIGAGGSNKRTVHTVVPIADETGTTVNRLFVYSETAE
jgi:hypothetical protein